MNKLQRALSAAAFLLGCAGGIAIAHDNGHESRTVSDCEKLPTPERGQCLSCVQRPVKHHYHPDYPPGNRCRPDNGKP